MTLFWIACAVLLLVALLFIVLPLWYTPARSKDQPVLRDAANLDILRDQSAELESDLRNGLLTQEAYEQGKRELQARLLEEVKTESLAVPAGPADKPARSSARALAIVLAISLPLFSVPIYLTIGDTRALLPQDGADATGDVTIIRSEAKLQELEKKLEKEPENPDGWFVLAQSYSEMQRYQDAVRAYGHLVRLVPDVAQLWANYADVYAMSNNQSLLGEPTRLLNRALELDGNNTMALALSGSAAMERGDYAAAVKHWSKLADLVPADNPDLPMIRNGIQQAKEFLSQQKGGKSTPRTAAKPALVISGKVSLNPALAGKASPDDTVYIFARDAGAQNTLIAVLRKQVKDLPLQFTLDDSMAIQPRMSLADFDRVVVLARISRSGDATVQSGDLEGGVTGVKPGSKGVNVVIDSVVP